MGIYFGCHCFNMTNGHASSCAAQFIYADVIKPLKWNIQWTSCQRCKVALTWPLLPLTPVGFIRLRQIASKVNTLALGKKNYRILEIDFFSLFCYFCGIDLKGRKKRISGVRHVKKIQFPKVASLKRKTFKPWKILSPVCGLWRIKTVSFSNIPENNF